VNTIDADGNERVGPHGSAETDASTAHRVRSVLGIRPFRRLLGITYLCGIADWLSLIALTGLISKLVSGYLAQSYSFSIVVLTQLLPGLLFAPLGGLLADRFDRRKVMVVVDLIRCCLFLSIALVGTWWWLFAANFLIGCTAMLWIPAKDSAIPNLLRRKDHIETVNQLNLVMTYGVTAVSAFGLYAVVTGINSNLHLWNSQLGVAKVTVVINGLLYLAAAITVATRIPEISGRRNVEAERKKDDEDKQSWFAMFSDGLRFARTTPLIRGLMIGMVGAFAAGGAVIGTAKLYATSLLGGDSAFSLLLAAALIGAGSGMAVAPRLAKRMSHNRMFGVAIVLAGLALFLVALSPTIVFSLLVVAVVGACAGVAFLTGSTIIGTQVEDSIRGRINSVYQSLMKVTLAGSTLLVPGLVGLVQTRSITVLGHPMIIDGTRPVLLGAGLLAIGVGIIAYRQMGDHSTEPIMANLLATIRRRPRHLSGLLIAVEGNTQLDTAAQARQLVDWLSTGTRLVHLASDPALDEARLFTVAKGVTLTGARAHALVAAAVRADVVEREVIPALTTGAIVVMERYVDSPLAQFGAAGELDQSELEGLADWATGRLRPDITVLLDRVPAATVDGAMATGRKAAEHNWRVQRLLTEMAAADPDRYLVINADAPEAEVAERVRAALLPALVARKADPRPVAAHNARSEHEPVPVHNSVSATAVSASAHTSVQSAASIHDSVEAQQ
jgi:dTMP kinase